MYKTYLMNDPASPAGSGVVAVNQSPAPHL